jgi:hypothetical protein
MGGIILYWHSNVASSHERVGMSASIQYTFWHSLQCWNSQSNLIDLKSNL